MYHSVSAIGCKRDFCRSRTSQTFRFHFLFIGIVAHFLNGINLHFNGLGDIFWRFYNLLPTPSLQKAVSLYCENRIAERCRYYEPFRQCLFR